MILFLLQNYNNASMNNIYISYTYIDIIYNESLTGAGSSPQPDPVCHIMGTIILALPFSRPDIPCRSDPSVIFAITTCILCTKQLIR